MYLWKCPVDCTILQVFMPVVKIFTADQASILNIDFITETLDELL